MHVCVHVCACACICFVRHVCECASARACDCMFAHMCSFVKVCVLVCASVRACLCSFTHLCVCACVLQFSSVFTEECMGRFDCLPPKLHLRACAGVPWYCMACLGARAQASVPCADSATMRACGVRLPQLPGGAGREDEVGPLWCMHLSTSVCVRVHPHECIIAFTGLLICASACTHSFQSLRAYEAKCACVRAQAHVFLAHVFVFVCIGVCMRGCLHVCTLARLRAYNCACPLLEWLRERHYPRAGECPCTRTHRTSSSTNLK